MRLNMVQHRGLGCFVIHVSTCTCAGHTSGKVSAGGVDRDATDAPPSLQDMMVPPEMNDTEAAKAVWTGTSVEPRPSGNV